jgi:hypothetical protein
VITTWGRLRKKITSQFTTKLRFCSR